MSERVHKQSIPDREKGQPSSSSSAKFATCNGLRLSGYHTLFRHGLFLRAELVFLFDPCSLGQVSLVPGTTTTGEGVGVEHLVALVIPPPLLPDPGNPVKNIVLTRDILPPSPLLPRPPET